ncbi:recombinase family protein [Thomasclavelia spiroformis]|mgnify:CR=1 FL=1|uniref:recombinase family protein n=1 Tax=Thomasclavelia spiroformis TaxID=29348 RepID=UPI0024B269AB|nr:recombinase family protein [Thomasclavelia spiroformis]
MSNTYFYMRISTKEETDKQSFRRQEKALETYAKNNDLEFNNRTVYRDDTTGATFEREDWQALEKVLKSGDTIIFKEISRFTRETEAGYKKYIELKEKGIHLIFLDNPTVSTDYIKKLTDIADEQQIIIKTALDNTVKLLLMVELDRVEQERLTIVKRIKQGLEVSDKKGGRKTGAIDKMTNELREDIKKYLSDRSIKQVDLYRKYNISRNTLSKYIKMVQAE